MIYPHYMHLELPILKGCIVVMCCYLYLQFSPIFLLVCYVQKGNQYLCSAIKIILFLCGYSQKYSEHYHYYLTPKALDIDDLVIYNMYTYLYKLRLYNKKNNKGKTSPPQSSSWQNKQSCFQGINALLVKPLKTRWRQQKYSHSVFHENNRSK